MIALLKLGKIIPLIVKQYKPPAGYFFDIFFRAEMQTKIAPITTKIPAMP